MDGSLYDTIYLPAFLEKPSHYDKEYGKLFLLLQMILLIILCWKYIFHKFSR